MAIKITELARKRALANVSAPEELDRALRVIQPRDWIWAAMIITVALAGLAWGWFGRIPVYVSGNGILLPYESVIELAIPSEGTVTDIAVKVGDSVKKGQILITLKNEDQWLQLQADEENLKLKQEEDKKLHDLESRQLTESKTKLDILLKALDKTGRLNQELLQLLTQEDASDEKLFEDRLLTSSQFLQTRQQLATLKSQIEASKSERVQNELSYQQTEQTVESSRFSRQEQLEQLSTQLEQARYNYKQATEIRAESDGTITELSVRKFEKLTAGSSVGTLSTKSRMDSGLRCVSFLSAKHAKAITTNMVAHISPTFAEKQRYGFILGKVDQVSITMANQSAIEMILPWGFDAGTSDGLLQVHATLDPDHTTITKYKWSSRGGYPHPITEGSLVSVEIAIEWRRPISFVVPWIKKQLGV